MVSGNESSLHPMTRSPQSQSPQIPQDSNPDYLNPHRATIHSPLRLEQSLKSSAIEEEPSIETSGAPPLLKPLPAHVPGRAEINDVALLGTKGGSGEIAKSTHLNGRTIDARILGESADNGERPDPAGSRKRPTMSDATTPSVGRRSVQFVRPTLNPEQVGSAHMRSRSWDLEEGGSNSKDRSGGSILSKIRALANTTGTPAHARSPSILTVGGDPADNRLLTTPFSQDSEKDAPSTPGEGSEVDADAEQSTGEDSPRETSFRKRRRRSRRPLDGALQTTPVTPKAASRPSLLSSASLMPAERFRPSFLTRRATMIDLSGENQQGVSEDEGRGRLSRNSPWRRGTAWVHGQHGPSYSGSRNTNQQVSTEERRPSNFRRFTGLGAPSDGTTASSFSPWKISRGERSERGERASSLSAARWRQQLKAGLNKIGPRRKPENTVDHAKSAELLAELTAGVPAALILASMFQRDEHGNKRIPILLEQLKVRLTESRQVDSKSGDRHMIFRIELEYGNGLTRMKWVIHRALKDFANLHARYKLQIGAQKYIQLRADDARTKLPHFPKSTFPYLRGIRGLDSDSDDDEDRDGEATGPSGGEASGLERPNKRKKRRPSANTIRRSSTGLSQMGADASPAIDGNNETSTRRDTYQEKQRKKLELYLQKMIRYLIFRPESNRLCKFLELSALGVRLAAEGSYHGKEGFLLMQSSKGADLRKALTPGLITRRHRPKWFAVRHSYLVCVDSPEEMNIYDVFMVDSSFQLQTQKRRIGDQRPKDLAKTAKESAFHPQHHSLKLFNSERKLKLLAKNERQLHQFEESIRFMSQNTAWVKPNRFGSFAPVRSNVFAQWLVDGRDYMWNVSRAINMAKDVIYIHDWWLSPELYMRRPAAISQKWRLDRLLQRKAGEGVKVFVIVYRNINSAIPIDSEHTKFSLLDLHPNVFVQRSPNQIRQNTFFWAHHEKICIVDHMVAFVGGIDLCFGRWDTPQHSVVDDKLTGFEASNAPKDADHCQLWPGKDYSNPREQDFYALDKPYEEMYDRSKIPRMPWHDIAMQIVGQPARDLTRHFVQRWNYILRQRRPTRPTPFLLPPPDFNHSDLKALGLDGTCEVQILRSTCWWSIGTPDKTEHSIMNAYIKMIEQSEHFVYIENQFFISSCEVEGTRIENRIGDALVERIIRASQKGEDWRAIIIIPLMPGFQNTVDNQDGTSVRLIMQCQFRSICRGDSSLFSRIRAEGIEPEDYISFYSLRSWGKIGPSKQIVTEQLYIHAKCMVVDDRIAIIGSANINERSMLGSRDSECAAVIRDTDMLWSTMACEPYLVGRFPHTLRMRLMREHLGIDVDEVMEDDRQEEERSQADRWEREMDEFHNEERTSDVANLDREAEQEIIRSKHQNQDDLLAKSENMRSINYNINSAQTRNLNLRSDQIRTQDSQEPDSAEQKDLMGDALDHFQWDERPGRTPGYSTKSPDNAKDFFGATGSATVTKHKSSDFKRSTSPRRSRSRANDDDTGNDELPPHQHLTRKNTAQLGLPMLSQLPSLPNTDDTDIGGPCAGFNASQKTADIVNPLVADMRRPLIDKDCMRDPLNESFFLDTWHAVAENNTKLFRTVFRCMPDNEVKTWKEYKEYVAYGERFSQSQGGGKSKDQTQQHGPSSSGPPGQSDTADRLRMLGPLGEKAGDAEGKVETFGGKILHTMTGKDAHQNASHLMGTVEEWAEEANEKESARHEEENEAKAALSNRLSSKGSDPLIDEKSATNFPGDGLKEFTPLKPAASPNADAPQKETPSSVAYSDTLSHNTLAQKRRRRTTTRSSRREFRASDDIINKADAESLMKMTQGHLVIWPYDWLMKEESGGNWLYSIDGLAPLEIYN